MSFLALLRTGLLADIYSHRFKHLPTNFSLDSKDNCGRKEVHTRNGARRYKENRPEKHRRSLPGP